MATQRRTAAARGTAAKPAKAKTAKSKTAVERRAEFLQPTAAETRAAGSKAGTKVAAGVTDVWLNDYDGAWKDALPPRLQLFLRWYFPKLHDEIDWTWPVEWLDKELVRVMRRGGGRRRTSRHVDLLAKVRLRSGEMTLILLHIEIQGTFQADFALRLATYNAALFVNHGLRVVTLAILTDLDPNWLPARDEFEVGGFRQQTDFLVCKLVSKLDGEWSGSKALPVLLARAQIEAQRTARDPEARFHAKVSLVRELYRQGYSADELRDVFAMIDHMMSLSGRWEPPFRQEIKTLEQEQNMPYVTSVERLAREEGKTEGQRLGRQQGERRGKRLGRQQGEQKGLLESALCVLSERLGPLPGALESAVQQLPLERLRSLIRHVLKIGSPQELSAWLQTQS